MGFSRQGYWRGSPCPPPGGSSRLKDGAWISCLAGRFFTAEPPGKPRADSIISCKQSCLALSAVGSMCADENSS